MSLQIIMIPDSEMSWTKILDGTISQNLLLSLFNKILKETSAQL